MTQLGVCPGSLSRITDLSQHASNGRKSEDGQFIAVEVLNIFGESTAAACPGSLSRITELSQHASDGRKSEDGQYIAVEVLNIFGVSTAAG